MADDTPITADYVRATPPSSPEISDAVVKQAFEASLRLATEYKMLDDGDESHVTPEIRYARALELTRAAISAAILADRESSRADTDRLKAELSQLKSDFDEVQQSESELEQACSDLDLQIEELTQERDAALSAASTAEEVLAKTIASIPVAMTAAAEKEREACAKIIDEQAPFLKDAVSSAVCASLSAAIRNRRDARNV